MNRTQALVVVLTTLLAAAGIIVLTDTYTYTMPTTSTVEAHTPPIEEEQPPVPTEEETTGDTPAAEEDPTQSEQATDPNTLTINTIGFNLPLADLAVAGAGSITPPDYTHGFVLTDWGVGRTGDTSSGSVYVITHSKRDGSGTGNYLFNPTTKTATVAEGTRINALGHEWEVIGSWHEDKEGLTKSERLWGNTPNSLYLITCLQIGDGFSASTDNFIIEARLVK